MAAKQKRVAASARDTDRVRALPAAFLEALQTEEVTRFPFGDETRTKRPYGRRYARAEGRQPKADSGPARPLHGGPTLPRGAALPPNGLPAAMTVSAAVKGAVLAAYLAQGRGPRVVAGDVVVPRGKRPAHQVGGRAELVEAGGARRLYWPPYWPDFTPLARAFRKLNTWLRSVQARTREALEAGIQAATDWVTERDAKNWFALGGYHLH